MAYPQPSEAFAQVEVNQLREQGCQVDIYCMHPRKKNITSATKESEHIHYAPRYRSGRNSLRAFFFYPTLVFKLVGLLLSLCWNKPSHLFKALFLIPVALDIFYKITKGEPDIVHLFWGHYPAILGWLWLNSKPSRKLSMFLGAYDLVAAFPLSQVVARELQVNERGLLFTHAKSNLADFNSMGLDSSQVVVSYRGINVDSNSIDESKAAKNSIFSAGRLIPEKGMALLIRSFSLVASDDLSLNLILAGSGPQQKELKELAESLGVIDRIEFIGHVPQRELFSRMADSKVFVLLSVSPSERLPNVVKEAMAQGVRPLVSYSPGIDELIPNYKLGSVINTDNVASVAEEIKSSLEYVNVKEDILSRNYRKKWISENFNVSLIMLKRYELWRELCRSR